MKKLFTLSIALGAVMLLNAQTSREEARKVILGGGSQKTSEKKSEKTSDRRTEEESRDVILGERGNTRTFPGTSTSGSREAQIDQVNREYDAKIQSIRNNPNLTQEEKARIINQLERERARKIKEINKEYKDRDDDDGDDDGYNKGKNKAKKKGNNGKHLGWEKGKGNPHKSGNTWKKGRGKS